MRHSSFGTIVMNKDIYPVGIEDSTAVQDRSFDFPDVMVTPNHRTMREGNPLDADYKATVTTLRRQRMPSKQRLPCIGFGAGDPAMATWQKFYEGSLNRNKVLASLVHHFISHLLLGNLEA
jgi:hypothetical protein